MFYKKGIDICNPKSMFEFIANHFRYDTLNSWNRLESIANNVKLYNLHLDGDWTIALSYLYDDNDIGNLNCEIHNMILEWEADHPGYALGFNGRSGGYLVIYNREYDKENEGARINFRNILPNWLDFKTYEDFKEELKYYGWRVKDMLPELREYTKLIQDFDKFCDQLRALVNLYSKRDYDADKKAFEVEYGIGE